VIHVITPFHQITAFPEEGVALVAEGRISWRTNAVGWKALVARTRRRRPPVTCRVAIGDPYHTSPTPRAASI
jgi:hypothetical protein